MRIANVTSTVTVEGYHAVPAADAVDNVLIRDVVGNKGDAYNTSLVLATTSLVQLVKGVNFVLHRPGADVLDNSWMREVVGSKTDTAQESVTATASLVRYMKGLIQELHQRTVPVSSRANTTSGVLADVVNITDKGVLTGILQYSEGADQGFIVVTIDGTIVRSVSPFCFNSMSSSLAFNHRFNTSLRVQHRNAGGAVQIHTEAAYTTD